MRWFSNTRHVGLWLFALVPIWAVMAGCAPGGAAGMLGTADDSVTAEPTDDTTDDATDDTTDDASDDTPVETAKVYSSPAGTSGLSLDASESGAAAITNFDPGAFVLSSSDDEAGVADPAQFDAPPYG